MSFIDLSLVIDMIAEKEWTVLVIDPKGSIREAIPFDSSPTAEWGYQNKSRLTGCGVKYVPRSTLTTAELQGIIDEVVNAIKLMDDYERNSED